MHPGQFAKAPQRITSCQQFVIFPSSPRDYVPLSV
jgi:hypothetical protein